MNTSGQAPAPGFEHGKADLFLMGMLSLMDAILEIPMGVVVKGLALDARVKGQLLQAKIGHESPLTPVYHLMLAREAGHPSASASNRASPTQTPRSGIRSGGGRNPPPANPPDRFPAARYPAAA